MATTEREMQQTIRTQRKNFFKDIKAALPKKDLKLLDELFKREDANPNITEFRLPFHDRTLLSMVVQEAPKDFVITAIDFLINKGADLNYTNHDVPLTIACKMDNPLVVEYLLSRGAHANPLLRHPNFFELYKKLVEEGKINTNKIDFIGDTPFIFAVRCVINNGDVLPIVRFLFSKNPDIGYMTPAGATVFSILHQPYDMFVTAFPNLDFAVQIRWAYEWRGVLGLNAMFSGLSKEYVIQKANHFSDDFTQWKEYVKKIILDLEGNYQCDGRSGQLCERLIDKIYAPILQKQPKIAFCLGSVSRLTVFKKPDDTLATNRKSPIGLFFSDRLFDKKLLEMVFEFSEDTSADSNDAVPKKAKLMQKQGK